MVTRTRNLTRRRSRWVRIRHAERVELARKRQVSVSSALLKFPHMKFDLLLYWVTIEKTDTTTVSVFSILWCLARTESNLARTRYTCYVPWGRNIAPPSPVESLQGGANSRTKPRRLDAREVFFISVTRTWNLTLWVLPLAFYFLLIESFVLSLLSSARMARYRKRYTQHCSALLAAARSQNGSGVINTIHYRSAASLPVERLQGGANSRTKTGGFDASCFSHHLGFVFL